MSRDSHSATSASMLVGEDWQVSCHIYRCTTPILAIGAGSATVCISIRPGEYMPAAGVAFAWELARRAEQFAAECERLNALHTQASSNSGSQEAAPLAAARRP